jgi:hypothetical protein
MAAIFASLDSGGGDQKGAFVGAAMPNRAQHTDEGLEGKLARRPCAERPMPLRAFGVPCATAACGTL